MRISEIDFSHAIASVMDALEYSDNVTETERWLVRNLLIHAAIKSSGSGKYHFPRICEKLNVGLSAGFITSDGRCFSEIEFVAEYLRSRNGMDGLSDEFILDEAYRLKEYEHSEYLPYTMTGHYECSDKYGRDPVWVKAY